MFRERGTLLGLLIAAIAGVGSVPFLLQADDPELDLRRRRIEAMTQAERERLERNFHWYETLNEADRQQLREFHEALNADLTNNRGRVAGAFSVYADWLQTITPRERDNLQRETDGVKRIVMIRELVDFQRGKRIDTRMGDRVEEFLGPIPELNRHDLLAILAVVDRKAALLTTSQDKLEGFEGMPRALKLFELMAKSGRSIRNVMTDTTSREMLEAISDEQARQQLQTIPESKRKIPENIASRFKLGKAIQRAIEAEIDRERRRRVLTQENIEGFFDNLPIEEQDELLALTPDAFREEVRDRFLNSQWKDTGIQLQLVRRFFNASRSPVFRSPVPNDRRRKDGPTRPARDD